MPYSVCRVHWKGFFDANGTCFKGEMAVLISRDVIYEVDYKAV